ncbi:hypothetical protein ABS767_02860 [Sphingomonas sp. ST-64]|uniref:Lipoprotein n=1 Tax=Sphingomonas plantiphila TaxID=3163295 RepID=A0ABW8YI02_9SPHN
MPARPVRSVLPRWVLPLLIPASLSGCGSSEPERFCGASFCLKDVPPQAVSRAPTPHDFAVYRLATTAGPLTIYEGNHPPDVSRSLDDFHTLADGRLRAIQRIDENVAITFVNVRPDQPRYVVISLPCRTGICQIDRIAARLIAR